MFLKMMSKNVKELVVRGIYSFFELAEARDGYSFILIKSDNNGVLFGDGLKPKLINNLDQVKLGRLLTVNDVTLPDSVVVDNVA